MSLATSPFYHKVEVPGDGKTPFTDYSRWRLSLSENGDHRWKYLRTDEECREWPQNDVDKYWLGLPLVRLRGPVTHNPIAHDLFLLT